MQNHSSFLDSLGHLIDWIFHGNCGQSKEECARLRQLNEHYAKFPAKQAGSRDLSHLPGLKLVAYTRDGGPSNSVEIQKEKIEKYCKAHGYSISAYYTCQSADDAHPLNDAIGDLEKFGGLIVSDLSRLVGHHEDPLRDLAPLMHEQFFRSSKTLISVKEGIDTSTTWGQEAMIEFLNELRDIEQGTC